MSEPGGLLLDVLSADQFNANHIDVISNAADRFFKPFEVADSKAELRRKSVMVELEGLLPAEIANVITDEVLALTADKLLEHNYMRLGRLAAYFWFEENSTRTVGSFNAARSLLGMARLGHTSITDTSLAGKGESFEDTMRVANEHLELFGGAVAIIRTVEVGRARLAADILSVPVINAGDGQNEHPTQALLDIYTIKKRLRRLDNLNVVMGGDPQYSRTIHSLAILLSLYPGNKITFVGSNSDWLEDSDTKSLLDSKGVEYQTTTELDPLSQADVVYWTRLQTERMNIGQDKKDILEEYGKKYAITDEILKTIPSSAIIMHPLPRGPEIPESIDQDERVAYWDQVENGVPVRAALIEMLLRHYYIVRVNQR